MELRPYQSACIEAVIDYWDKGGGNPLCDLATGTGKSVILSGLIQRLMAGYPELRVLMLVHVRELVEQNAKALLRAWPQAPLGINSAGLGRRDKRSPILFASIQSIANEDSHSIGHRDLVIIDEAHLTPKAGHGQYRKLLNKLREANPDLRVIGFTATPYRLDSGRLDDGDGAIFNDIAFSYGIGQAVDEGWLSPLISRRTGTVIDVSGVAKRGGEFIAGDLEAAVNIDAITQAACAEIIERGADRKSWIVFCAGVAHAETVRDALKARGILAETITGTTPKAERARLIAQFKAGQIRALTNANVLTTGFDAPSVDLIAMLRPTLSTSLYVQMCGRGTRLAKDKTNCLVLDFAQNVRRHGPVDAISIDPGKRGSDTGKVKEDAIRAKQCPICEALNAIGTFECIECGHEWERPALPKHDARPDTEAPVMAREIVDKWLPVTSAFGYPHAKDGSPTSLRAEYMTGLQVYREWITLEHHGFAGDKARRWWRAMSGIDAPRTTMEAITLFREQIRVLAITIARDGKYWRIVKHRVKRADGRIYEIDDKFTARPVMLELVKEFA